GVIDAVEVGDLVDERHVDLLPELVEVGADREQRLPKQDNAVGQLPEAVVAALGERDPLIDPEQVERAVVGTVLDDEDQVLETVDHLVREQVELLDDERLEGVRVEVDPGHRADSSTGPGPASDSLSR